MIWGLCVIVIFPRRHGVSRQSKHHSPCAHASLRQKATFVDERPASRAIPRITDTVATWLERPPPASSRQRIREKPSLSIHNKRQT